jgi:glutathione peroxidase
MKQFDAPQIMPLVLLAASFLVMGCGPAQSEPKVSTETKGVVIDQVVQSLKGESVDLAGYRGKALLIVNTASKCGFTPQYEGLQTLHEQYSDRGLVVIGFPSNDFGSQEPGSAEEIATFCTKNYGVSFPMMAKVHAKGPDKAPIYRALTEQTADGIRGKVRWNFTKFLVDPEGNVVARFGSSVKPTSKKLTAAIEAALPG